MYVYKEFSLLQLLKASLIGPRSQENRIQPEKNHKHDDSDVLRTRHRLRDSPHVQRWPDCHGACHSCDVDLLLSVN